MSTIPPDQRQEIIDAEHLRVLSICYYVMGGVVIFFSCFALIYVVMGLVLALMPEQLDGPRHGEPPPAVIGFVIAGIGGCFLCLGWAFGALAIYVGRSLAQHRRRTLTLVLAAIYCLSIPFGTLLGVFTFVVLLRDSVMRLYEKQAEIDRQNLLRDMR
jgi:hypothetical protein